MEGPGKFCSCPPSPPPVFLLNSWVWSLWCNNVGALRKSVRESWSWIFELRSYFPRISNVNLCSRDLGGVYMRKLAPARVSPLGDFLIPRLPEGTSHIDKIQAWIQIANKATMKKSRHVLPVPGHREADFTSERVDFPRLHDTVARFRAGTKFSRRCESPQHDFFRWSSCKQIQS